MAKHAETLWEVRTTGNNNNGGGWRDYGGASTDYSNQDAAELNLANCSVSGTTLTDDDAGGSFTAAMVGSIVNILTKGRFQITAHTDGDNVTVDAAPGDGAALTIYVGGAVADCEEIDGAGNYVAGNTIHVKAGTYTLAGNIYFVVNGTSPLPIKIYGYNTSRGDQPTGNNRPFFDGGANFNFRVGNNYWLWNHRVESEVTNVLYMGQTTLVANCYVHNDSGFNRNAYYSAGYGNVIMDSELIADSGVALNNSAGRTRIIGCYIHDSVSGVQWGSYSQALFCIFDTCSTRGIGQAGDSNSVMNSTFYNCGTGHDIGGDIAQVALNNQYVNCTLGVTNGGGAPNILDYNNFFNNTADLGGTVVKGPNTTANDPGFADAPGGNFSGVDSADGFGIRVGVG